MRLFDSLGSLVTDWKKFFPRSLAVFIRARTIASTCHVTKTRFHNCSLWCKCRLKTSLLQLLPRNWVSSLARQDLVIFTCCLIPPMVNATEVRSIQFNFSAFALPASHLLWPFDIYMYFFGMTPRGPGWSASLFCIFEPKHAYCYRMLSSIASTKRTSIFN